MASKVPIKAKNKTGHIMISYQWNSQNLMKKFASKLKSEGYKVWMDIENMKGNLNDEMAKAVDGASVVLIAMSKKYEESQNCKKEAEYAEHKGKLMIPLLVEKGYRPDKWLGLVVGKLLYYDLTKEGKVDQKITDVIRAIGDRGKDMGANSDAVSQSMQQEKMTQQMQYLLSSKDTSSEEDQIEARITATNWIYIKRKPTSVSKRPHLTSTRWRLLTEAIKPVLVEALFLQEVNVGLCYKEVFHYTLRCNNCKQLLLYDITDDSDDDSDLVIGLISTVHKLDKLRWLNVGGCYLGRRATELFDSLEKAHDVRVLSLSKTNITESCSALISLLSRAPLLSFLSLFCCGLSPEEMKQVLICLPSSCSNLLYCNIGGIEFSFKEFQPVFRLKKLKSVSFEASSDADLIQIVKQLPRTIEKLYLSGSKTLSKKLKDLISIIASYPRLQYLMVNEELLSSEDETVLGSKLTKTGCRLVMYPKDSQGFQDFKDANGKLRAECFNAK